mmetsp:Transcript_82280/g.255527  ORF Transcript_82280/g.255527 Transcript_82280/m.255527 type:complete len:226 (+) Transcript_82280:1-678(+)
MSATSICVCAAVRHCVGASGRVRLRDMGDSGLPRPGLPSCGPEGELHGALQTRHSTVPTEGGPGRALSLPSAYMQVLMMTGSVAMKWWSEVAGSEISGARIGSFRMRGTSLASGWHAAARRSGCGHSSIFGSSLIAAFSARSSHGKAVRHGAEFERRSGGAAGKSSSSKSRKVFFTRTIRTAAKLGSSVHWRPHPDPDFPPTSGSRSPEKLEASSSSAGAGSVFW